jgi:LysM repeat protein
MTTPPGPAAAGSGGSLVAKVGGPRNAAILGAGLTVALVAVVSNLRSKGGTTGTTSMTTADTYDSSPYDMWNAWQSEYEDLQEQISAGGTNTAGGGAVPPPVPGGVLTPGPPVPVPIPKPPVITPAPKPPAPKPIPKPPTTTTHKTVVVKKGDTLSEIAKKNHITMATLRKLNPVYWTNKKYKNGNLIWAGDKVKVS